MSGNGANPDEMAFLHNPAADPELAEFATALRAELVRAPDRAGGAALVPKLAEQARLSAARGPSPAAVQSSARSRRGLAVKLGIAAVSVPLLTAGLAVAGVKLPDPAQSAFERVGIELPNQEQEVPAGKGGAGESPGASGGSDAEPGAGAPTSGGGQGVGRAKPSKGSKNRGGGAPAGRGRSDAAPGHNKPERGPAEGRAIGKTGSTPPGQASKPARPVKPAKPVTPAKPPPSSSGKGASKK